MSNISLLAQTIGKSIEQDFRSTSDRRDCRLLVPGLTPNIGKQIHNHLISKGITSYLVIGNEQPPNKEQRLITAIGLTSVRTGSFVAVTNPGQLANVQDSIRGSGGTIRSLAFSEEWPWIDNGSESFRFNGPILNSLVKHWSNKEEEQKWLHEFILSGLLKDTRENAARKNIFLETILNSFSAELYPEIESIQDKLLYHCGIPSWTSVHLPDVKKLNREILNRCHSEENIREQAKERVQEFVKEPDEQNAVRKSLDIFLDGTRDSFMYGPGLLALHKCWGNSNDTSHWTRLPAELLKKLFGVKNSKDLEKIKFSCTIHCEGRGRGCGKRLATFLGEEIKCNAKYDIPKKQFNSSSWSIKVSKRKKIIKEQSLSKAAGDICLQFDADIDNMGNYSKKIPIRITLVSNNNTVEEIKLGLHLCGKERPAFVVVDQNFKVFDAIEGNRDDESSDKKIEVNEPVHVFLFSHDIKEIHFQNEEEKDIDLQEIESGKQRIQRSEQRIDPSTEPNGQIARECVFDKKRVVLLFEATDIENGEFTIEDELRRLISEGTKNDNRIKKLVSLFKNRKEEPYTSLGKIDKRASHKIHLAEISANKTEGKPLLTNLLSKDFLTSKEFASLGDLVNQLGPVEGNAFLSLSLPEKGLSLLRAYSDARKAIKLEIESNLDSTSTRIQHPTYASHPIFVQENTSRIELLLQEYLDAYCNILTYANSNKNLDHAQLLSLLYLDCIVHWSNDNSRNTFFLIGPWHPLVLAKRFMVQSALFYRGDRFCQGGKHFKQLTCLLRNIQGFRWMLSLSPDRILIESTYIAITSDPGWHLAVTKKCFTLQDKEESSIFSISKALQENLGLTVMLDASGDNILADTCLRNYSRTFPSRRSIGIRVCPGYSNNHIIKTVGDYLHFENEPTEHGAQLPGGVRLYFEDYPDFDENVPPSLLVYQYDKDDEFIQNAHPDIYMLSPINKISFIEEKTQLQGIPRGSGYSVVLHEPINLINEGSSHIPINITHEFDVIEKYRDGFEGAFLRVLNKISSTAEKPTSAINSIDLPQKLNAPWVVIPGQLIDPAILVKYVKDGAEKSIEERALWDYNIDITGKETSFFVLSTIPQSFKISVNRFFNEGNDIANSFIIELGKIGVAIGGEALRSGRHALGIIGLMGAVNILVGKTKNGETPLVRTPDTTGFLVPVDSFSLFFGKNDPADKRRTDLLAIQLTLPHDDSKKLQISACGIESKFVSGKFGYPDARPALQQAKATLNEFRELTIASLREGGIPERLALLKILKFGLRITSPSRQDEIKDWAHREKSIYECLLTGNYKYVQAKHDAILVTTEGQLSGSSEHKNMKKEGFWIRLTKDDWPAPNLNLDAPDTPRLDEIRQELCKLFDTIIPTSQAKTPEQDRPKTMPTSNETPKEEVDVGKEIPLKKILLGCDESRKAAYFDPQSPENPLDNTNIMVTGSSGKGKTQLLKSIICQLREQEKNVLVLDMKRDFADDGKFCQKASLEKIFVTFDGLPFNPLIPYPVKHPGTEELFIQPGQYITNISSVLKKAYGLGAQQQFAVKDAIAAAFSASDIPVTGSIPFSESLRFPNFQDIGTHLQQSNIKAYNRLDPLFTLDLFREEFREQSFSALIDRAIALDLSQIPSDEIKNTLAQLIVLSAHAYYNTQSHPGSIKQFLIFDEAHRVLDSDYILKLVRECRAYGVGTILSSQYPSDFPKDISASMATKIIHGNGKDSEKVKDIVNLLGCPEQESRIANLERFEAFIDNNHHSHTFFRTMNYPLYLIWTKLRELKKATREELSQTEGFDSAKLPIDNLVRQLEYLGLAQEREEGIFLSQSI